MKIPNYAREALKQFGGTSRAHRSKSSRSASFVRTYLAIQRIQVFGARLYIHWTAIMFMIVIAAISLKQPIAAALSVISYFSVTLLHETGHAFVAKRLGYPPITICISIFHGACEYPQPYYAIEDYKVAWGGVLAQIAVAIPLIILATATPLGNIKTLEPVFLFLGYLNILIAFFNLLPYANLDGQKAWRLIPMLVPKRKPKPSGTKNKNSSYLKRMK